MLEGVWHVKMRRRCGLAGMGATVVAFALAAAAWACVAGPTLQATPQNATAGSEVQISGISYNEELPVVVRFDSLDGPVLGEFSVNDDRRLEGEVTIPAGTQPGNYLLIATQEDAAGGQAIIPSRALVSVVGEGGAPTLGAPLAETPVERTAGLTESEPVSTGTLVLVAVGVAGIALFLAGVGVLISGRGRPEPEAERVK